MSLGARPLDERAVRAIIDGKMRDFASVAQTIRLRHLDLDGFVEVAREDPDIRFAVTSGFICELADELRDPVIVQVESRRVYSCPELAVRVLAEEPAEIHRAFVEGTFFRKLFRFFVPAHQEGGERLEAVQQVRQIMRRHFALQLVVTETILEGAA